MIDRKEAWISCGYQIFAFEGPHGLNVEKLSRRVGKNKSSFYHLFADLNIFQDQLLGYHIERAHIIAEREAQAGDVETLIDILVEFKSDLLFNRQLRVHHHNNAFLECANKTNEITSKAFMPLWQKMLDLEDKSYLASLVLKLSMDNFYLQISLQTLNRQWLSKYFNNLLNVIKELRNHS